MNEVSPIVADFTLSDSVGYLLRRAHRTAMQLAEEAFVREELSFIQWVALVQLRDGMADTASGLARCIGHDAGAMTRLLDQLEERGLLRRERSTADRRVVHLALSDEGRAAVGRLLPRIMGVWDGLLDDFSAAEVASLTKMLQRLVARMDIASAGGDL